VDQFGDPFDVPATGVGSGVLFDARGWVITNRHVVCGASSLSVKLADGREFPATTYGIDSLTDLAIVQVTDTTGLPAAPIGDSTALKPGQLAVAIGSPLGTYTNSVTSGVISALRRDVEVLDSCGTGQTRTLRNLVQTDAAINPGNSGGALVDALGSVVGINTAVAGDLQGIGFAIPVNIAKPIMKQAQDGKPLTRPWMGVAYVPVTPALRDEADLPIDYGILVRGSDDGTPAVTPGSPADRAGIQEGDIIAAINGMRIDGGDPLDEILTQYGPDSVLTLSVLRDGELLELTLTLGTRAAQA
jgi:serine protease Do